MNELTILVIGIAFGFLTHRLLRLQREQRKLIERLGRLEQPNGCSYEFETTYVAPRLCDNCGKPIASPYWEYGWCEECQNKNCRHGNPPHDCNECMVESDLAYDARR